MPQGKMDTLSYVLRDPHDAADEFEQLRADCTDKATAWDKMTEHSAELARLRQFVDFVNLWCNRESKISDGERLSMIRFHPTAQAALRNKAAG